MCCREGGGQGLRLREAVTEPRNQGVCNLDRDRGGCGLAPGVPMVCWLSAMAVMPHDKQPCTSGFCHQILTAAGLWVTESLGPGILWQRVELGASVPSSGLPELKLPAC